MEQSSLAFGLQRTGGWISVEGSRVKAQESRALGHPCVSSPSLLPQLRGLGALDRGSQPFGETQSRQILCCSHLRKDSLNFFRKLHG